VQDNSTKLTFKCCCDWTSHTWLCFRHFWLE